MNLLLDTHVFSWWFFGDKRLVPNVRSLIEQNDGDTCVSAISGYEMALKFRLGKWPEVEVLITGFEALCAANGFRILPILPAHAVRGGLLPSHHRDPFDRLIVAQAAVEGLRIVSGDPALADLGADTIWR